MYSYLFLFSFYRIRSSLEKAWHGNGVARRGGLLFRKFIAVVEDMGWMACLSCHLMLFVLQADWMYVYRPSLTLRTYVFDDDDDSYLRILVVLAA